MPTGGFDAILVRVAGRAPHDERATVGVPIREARLPEGVTIGAIVRGDEVIIPRGDTVTRANDLVVIFARSDAVKRVEKLFAVKLEFF